jgi:hypothetical protein
MTLAASGTIAASDLRTEFVGGSSAIDMASYYRGANTNVKSNASNNTATNLSAGVPTSGAISFSDFYSQAKGWKKTFSSNSTQQSGTSIFGDDYAVDYPKFIVINADVTVYSTSTSAAAIDIASGGAGSITVTNSGNIYGMGGASGQGGGTALAAAVSTTVVNNSGANIKGGGGGGGNGGLGGVGSAAISSQVSSVTDKTGDKPDFVSYSVLTQFGPRAWSGIGSGEWGLNVQQGTSMSSSISNMGPMWYRFQVNTSAEYSLSASINNPFQENNYGGHQGNPVINISTAEDVKSQGQGGGDYGAGTSWTVGGWSGVKANLAANTTYYFCNYTEGPYGSSTGGTGRFFYNNMYSSISLAVRSPTSGGAAGAGGVGQGFAQSATNGSSGGSGGSNAGSGGAGGAGGALGANGTAGSAGGNGSGTTISYPSTAPTNGAAGSSAGSSGYYILGNSNVSLTQNGTVAGNLA